MEKKNIKNIDFSTLKLCIEKDLFNDIAFTDFSIDDKIKNIINDNSCAQTITDNIKNLLLDYIKSDYIDFSNCETYYNETLLLNSLTINNCKDNDFLLYKYKELDSEYKGEKSINNIIDDFKINMPYLFYNNDIKGIIPESSFVDEGINKDCFKNMKYNEKLDLFNNNKSLYKSLI